MTDPVWARDEIESPCVKICVVHPGARICVGCHRTLDEIADWSRMTPEARRDVIDALPARAAAFRDPAHRPSRRRRGG